jgi:hypothetical protein
MESPLCFHRFPDLLDGLERMRKGVVISLLKPVNRLYRAISGLFYCPDGIGVRKRLVVHDPPDGGRGKFLFLGPCSWSLVDQFEVFG